MDPSRSEYNMRVVNVDASAASALRLCSAGWQLPRELAVLRFDRHNYNRLLARLYPYLNRGVCIIMMC